MRPIWTERGDQFRRQLHALSFQFLKRLRHRMAIVENHQVGNQMIVLDDFQLILAHIFLNGVRSEIGPLRKVVETFALVLRCLDDLAQLIIADIFQQEYGADDPAQLAKGEIQLVFPAGGAQLAQDGRWRNAPSPNRLRHLQHVRQMTSNQIPIDCILGKQVVDVFIHFVGGRAEPFQVFPVADTRHQLDTQQKRQTINRRALRLGIAMQGVGLNIRRVFGESIQDIHGFPDTARNEMREQRDVRVADMVVSNAAIAAVTDMPFRQQIIFIQVPLRTVCCRAFCVTSIAWQLKFIVRIDRRTNSGLQFFRRDLALIDE